MAFRNADFSSTQVIAYQKKFSSGTVQSIFYIVKVGVLYGIYVAMDPTKKADHNSQIFRNMAQELGTYILSIRAVRSQSHSVYLLTVVLLVLSILSNADVLLYDSSHHLFANSYLLFCGMHILYNVAVVATNIGEMRADAFRVLGANIRLYCRCSHLI